jgi:hypothetical protein
MNTKLGNAVYFEKLTQCLFVQFAPLSSVCDCRKIAEKFCAAQCVQLKGNQFYHRL